MLYCIIDRTPAMLVNVNSSSILTSDAESDMKTQPLKVSLVMNKQIALFFSQTHTIIVQILYLLLHDDGIIDVFDENACRILIGWFPILMSV